MSILKKCSFYREFEILRMDLGWGIVTLIVTEPTVREKCILVKDTTS